MELLNSRDGPLSWTVACRGWGCIWRHARAPQTGPGQEQVSLSNLFSPENSSLGSVVSPGLGVSEETVWGGSGAAWFQAEQSCQPSARDGPAAESGSDRVLRPLPSESIFSVVPSPSARLAARTAPECLSWTDSSPSSTSAVLMAREARKEQT